MAHDCACSATRLDGRFCVMFQDVKLHKVGWYTLTARAFFDTRKSLPEGPASIHEMPRPARTGHLLVHRFKVVAGPPVVLQAWLASLLVSMLHTYIAGIPLDVNRVIVDLSDLWPGSSRTWLTAMAHDKLTEYF